MSPITQEKNKKVQPNQFVRFGLGYQGFGIVDNIYGANAYVMTTNMTEDFGTTELPLNQLVCANETHIQSVLQDVSTRYEEFPYFILQLNEIPELSAYHIEENEFIQNVRKTNETLNE